jgi:hypothetical protein
MCPCYQLDPSVAEESGYDGEQSQAYDARCQHQGIQPMPETRSSAGLVLLCRHTRGCPPKRTTAQHQLRAKVSTARSRKYNCQCCISLLDFHSGRIMALGKWQF